MNDKIKELLLSLVNDKINIDKFNNELEKDYDLSSQKDDIASTFNYVLNDNIFELARNNKKLYDLIYVLSPYVDTSDLINKYQISLTDAMKGYYLDKEHSSAFGKNLFEYCKEHNVIFNEEEQKQIEKLFNNSSIGEDFYKSLKSALLSYQTDDDKVSEEELRDVIFAKNNLDFIMRNYMKMSMGNGFWTLNVVEIILEDDNKEKLLSYLAPESFSKLFGRGGAPSEIKIEEILVNLDPNNIFYLPYFKGSKALRIAVNKGIKLNEDAVKRLGWDYFMGDLKMVNLALETDPKNALHIYPICNWVEYDEEKGLTLAKNKTEFYYSDMEYFANPILAKLAIDNDPNNVFILPLTFNYNMLLEYAIEKGLDLSYENLHENDTDNIFNDQDLFIKAIKYDYNNILKYSGSNLLFKCTSYYLQSKNINKSSSNIDKMFEEALNVSRDFLDRYQDTIYFYKGDLKSLFLNEKYFKYFLGFNNINEKDFIQYSFGSSYDWINAMLKYNSYDDINSFKKFFNYYCKQTNKEENTVTLLNNFISCLKGYSQYKEFCDSLVSSKVDLSRDNIMDIDVLFDYDSSLNQDLIPKNIDDLTNFSRKSFDSNIDYFFNCKNHKVKKNIFCRTVLNNDLEKVINLLNTYGDTSYLIQLQFENKNDIYLCRYIEEMKRYTTLFEFVINLTDEDEMNNIMNNISNDKSKRDTVYKWSRYLSNYEEKINKMYAKETLRNLTDINNINDNYLKDMIDKESTSKSGINVYDFSNKNYGLLAHVKSSREDIDNLVTGKSSINQSFICLSAVSYIKQRYYGVVPKDIVFGYSDLPSSNFIMSATSNMGSNIAVNMGSSKVNTVYREQRGFKDTSSAPEGFNSEFLCYREGLKPSCIILPDGREPNEDEIEVAKKYNLYFVKTQKNNEMMSESPEKIEYKDDYLKDEYDMTPSDVSEFKKLMNISNNKRKICIFTDSHGLFEPTLAILEDARKHGVKEFYSLGDNVGTGPNPDDVLKLLDLYDVKSVKGNHEMYVIDGIEGFKKHLHGYQVEEAKNDSDWTRSKLSNDQIEKIRNYPDSLVIEVSGKKMLLCHHLNDFNTNKTLYDPNDYEAVFQGHEHFENKDSNVYTVRGAGIGYSANSNDTGKAKYMEITETEDGKYYISINSVPFYIKNAKRDIIESDGPSKDKMSRWLK